MVFRAVRVGLDGVRSALPPGVTLTVAYDQADLVGEAL
jgi:Cu/Ag efflux pump CusA